ncbi:MAG TPA: type I-C CRISPR-associated protein Cas7/Csd2 [Rectinema sp.]|nr:type I-C CRISPR-associated protein Cas7/Csd2 [Spirochaetaceae bacterium]HOR91450.1 type I-C CRISPR-associated protein Cas7/Csd2 [Rectinema sp.]HQE69189.1 type I-C CRISPR-associated protein Cas7/Csd2 [Rectinema sp.]HRU03466.1 type I-C CRISPR-associated protein Cas7/Csd2 [Rectinema sp.]
MATLTKKIDFAAIICVNNANPNGDPLNGNRPRTTYDNLGEISDVAIKRKIRNRLQDMNYPIFVQSEDNKVDNYPSLRARAEIVLKDFDPNDKKKYQEAACKAWIDVRAFGQVFAYSGKKGKKNEGQEDSSGISISVRGPVSIHSAFSVAPVLDRISSIQITKSASDEAEGKRGPDTMGMKHRVDHGVYVFYGSMNPQLATKTFFSDEDAAAIKEAIRTLFVNDASSARPEGSMEVYRLFWWEHNSPNGQYSSAKVHRSLSVKVKDGIDEPKSIDDYQIELAELPGLKYDPIEGE